jgi:Mrp family chromosome partitioning ATPase
MSSPNGDPKTNVLALLEELPGVADVVWATATRLATARGPRRVLFTAAEKRAGTTLLASATALGLARHQRATVCLLETNVRRPAVAGYFGLEGTGLSDILDGRAELDDGLQEVRDCPGLFVLPAGTPRGRVPGEFTTDRMRSTLEHLQQRCRYFVLDAAPLLDHIESRLLLHHSDAVVLVLRAESSRLTDAERAHDILVESGTPVLGSIFNAYRGDALDRDGRLRPWFERFERARRDYATAMRSALRGGLGSVVPGDSLPEPPELAVSDRELVSADGSPDIDLPARTGEGSEAAHRRQIDIYERRIRKLNQLLAQTEADLARMARMKDVDPGIASAYRKMQGLPSEDEANVLKRSLLQQILEANLELKIATERRCGMADPG